MKPLQHLNDLIRTAMIEKYPEIRPELLPKKHLKCNSANTLTQCVLKWLRLHGHQAERINTQGRRIDQTRITTDCLGYKRQIGSVKWVPGTGTKGSADISAIIQGKAVKIEIKWGRDRQSEDQRVYQSNVEMAGGVYLIVHTFEEFYEWYGSYCND